MRRTSLRAAKVTAAVSAGLTALALAGPASASSTGGNAAGPQFHAWQILNGANLSHTFVPAGSSTSATESLSSPDDVTMLGHVLFVAFQNGVGPQGQPSADGNTDSTIVEFTAHGSVIFCAWACWLLGSVSATLGRFAVSSPVHENELTLCVEGCRGAGPVPGSSSSARR